MMERAVALRFIQQLRKTTLKSVRCTSIFRRTRQPQFDIALYGPSTRDVITEFAMAYYGITHDEASDTRTYNNAAQLFR